MGQEARVAPETHTTNVWEIVEDRFDPRCIASDPYCLNHDETVFTIGNGYLSTRGAFEENYPNERRATFIHGVFDGARVVNTELVNVIDWLPLNVYLDGERFMLTRGTLESYERRLDLHNGLLSRRILWQAPGGARATLTFERFASLADPHTLYERCRVLPEFDGVIEFRAGLNGHMDNLGVTHCNWIDQGVRDTTVFLHHRTRQSGIDVAYAMQVELTQGKEDERHFWDAESMPAIVIKAVARSGEPLVLDKQVAIYTSRDVPAAEVESAAIECIKAAPHWDPARQKNDTAWVSEWDQSDIVIDGDDQAQQAVRFNIYELLIAAPRHDPHVSIGAKTLSGFGYRGHVFWDTEIFMLPFFVFTQPEVARNLLDYRYERLEASRAKAHMNGYEGAQFAWESADTGEEVTPTWIPDVKDRSKQVRIWTGDIEIHISADIAYAVYMYWTVTGDDDWMTAKGAEIILDTAKFWGSRAEWKAEANRYEYDDVVGPDEYHEHVNNNAYTNVMAQWNLKMGLHVLDWLRSTAPARAEELIGRLQLMPERLARWRDIIDKTYVPMQAAGVIEQFDGYDQLKYIDLETIQPRAHSAQQILGMDGVQHSQIIKQPDVLMLLYLLPQYPPDGVRLNYDYYAPRTDSQYGSSLGPGILATMACEAGKKNEAYVHFWRGARADLYDVRGNAGDGIHGASAGGTWQAVFFGFAGVRVNEQGWSLHPCLPHDWKRLAFKFWYHGKQVNADLKPDEQANVPDVTSDR